MGTYFDKNIENIYLEIEKLKNISNRFDALLTEIENKVNKITSHIYNYDGIYIE